MTDYAVLEATTQHIAKILEIDRETRRPWTDEYIHLYTTAPRHRTFVLKSTISEAVYGYACVRMVNKELKIEKLVIKSSLRRLGLGRYLLAAVLSRLTFFDLTTVCIEVDERDTAEAMFYRACGFFATLTKNRYEGIYDGYLMRRDYPAETNILKILKDLKTVEVGESCA